jgi:hypothetical protein
MQNEWLRFYEWLSWENCDNAGLEKVLSISDSKLSTNHTQLFQPAPPNTHRDPLFTTTIQDGTIEKSTPIF